MAFVLLLIISAVVLFGHAFLIRKEKKYMWIVPIVLMVGVVIAFVLRLFIHDFRVITIIVYTYVFVFLLLATVGINIVQKKFRKKKGR